MLLQTMPSVATDDARATRRRKQRARRIRRELRLFAPLLAMFVECLVLASVILLDVRIHVAPGLASAGDIDLASGVAGEALRADAYGPTTSISSTSNVSAAPPGIRPGDPLSP
jgi:hypothetical protein